MMSSDNSFIFTQDSGKKKKMLRTKYLFLLVQCSIINFHLIKTFEEKCMPA